MIFGGIFFLWGNFLFWGNFAFCWAIKKKNSLIALRKLPKNKLNPTRIGFLTRAFQIYPDNPIQFRRLSKSFYLHLIKDICCNPPLLIITLSRDPINEKDFLIQLPHAKDLPPSPFRPIFFSLPLLPIPPGTNRRWSQSSYPSVTLRGPEGRNRQNAALATPVGLRWARLAIFWAAGYDHGSQ